MLLRRARLSWFLTVTPRRDDGHMDLWYPPKDRPHLLEWWRPLILASKAARLAGSPWPIHVDELILRGRIDRGSRPAIWVYANPVGGGELYLDGTGQAYKFTKTASGRSLGRFSACGLESAIWAAGLPHLHEADGSQQEQAQAHAKARATHPAARSDSHGVAGVVDPSPRSARRALPGAADAHEPSAVSGAPRRRGHLTVHEGGRQLAG